MPSPLYARLEATARRLIGAYGKPAVIVREERSGPPYAPVVTRTEHPCTLVETGYSITNRDTTLVAVGDKVGIISTDAAVAPALEDSIRIDGAEYRIADLQPLNPGGQVLLYEFIAKQ